MALVAWHSLPICAAITNFAFIVATPHLLCGLRAFVCRVVFTILAQIICKSHHHLCTTVWTYKKACMTNQTCVAQDANHLLACGTLHTSSKSDEVMIASMCVKGTICRNNSDHIYLVTFGTLSRWCR